MNTARPLAFAALAAAFFVPGTPPFAEAPADDPNAVARAFFERAFDERLEP
jgi:hypothetical protein